MREVVRYLTGSTGLIGGATSIALPVGIVSALITVHYLRPTQYGELALLMVFAGFLAVVYNVGLLHGTFLWVYGSSGEAGDDLEIEGMGRAGVATQRSAMGTGMLLTLLLVALGTTLFFIFKQPLASLLLGNSRDANLIGWAAISGGAGSLYRLTCNVFRFERRRTAFAWATMARPLLVLVGSSVLLIAGYGVWGAVVGTALPTLACAVGCMAFTRRSYALAFSLSDAREIVIRGAAVVIPVLGLFALHNGDIYVLAHWVHGAPLGVYRLASRLGSPPSYLASAFIICWSPIERSALGAAWYESKGHAAVRSGVITYYVLAGLTIVVLFVLFSGLFVLIAPRSYAEAAQIVPLIALAFVTYGGFIVVLRTVRPDRLILWYSITSVVSVVGFLVAAAVLIPAFGVYGPGPALTIGLGIGIGILLMRNRVKEDPLPIESRRIFGGLAVAGLVSAASLLGGQAGPIVSAAVNVACLLAYLPALVLVGAIPSSHAAVITGIFFGHDRRGGVKREPSELTLAEQDVLERFRAGALAQSRVAVDYARLTRALRRVGEIGNPSTEDSRIGLYLASPEPESIRDFQLQILIGDGIDAFELHRLDVLAKAAKRGKLQRRGKRSDGRLALRARARSLGEHELGRLHAALEVLAGRRDEAHPDGHGAAGLPRVRALREVRELLDLGAPSAIDPALAGALGHPPRAELSRRERAELRRVRAAMKLAPQRDGVESHGPVNPGAVATGLVDEALSPR